MSPGSSVPPWKTRTFNLAEPWGNRKHTFQKWVRGIDGKLGHSYFHLWVPKPVYSTCKEHSPNTVHWFRVYTVFWRMVPHSCTVSPPNWNLSCGYANSFHHSVWLAASAWCGIECHLYKMWVDFRVVGLPLHLLCCKVCPSVYFTVMWDAILVDQILCKPLDSDAG